MINGITFDLQNVQSADDAKLFWRLNGKQNGVMTGCAVTESGGTLTVAAGYMIAYGRLSKITGTEQKSAPTTTGTIYCRIVYEIDLSQVNTAAAFNQGAIKIIQGSSSDYPALTQQDLDNGGNVYQMPLAKFIVTGNGVSGLTDERELTDNAGEYLIIDNVKYKIRRSTTDAGLPGYITFVTES